MVYKVLYGLKFSICLASPNTSHLALFALAICPLTLLLPPLQALSQPTQISFPFFLYPSLFPSEALPQLPT